MNNRGQLGMGIMAMIILVVLGLMMTNFIMDEVNTARAALTCASPDSISDGTKLLCLVFDITIPYWIIIIFSVAGGAVLTKLAMR